MTRFLFIFFRGTALYKKYFVSNFISIAALTGLFLILHTGFTAGGSIAGFIKNFAAFDKIRVYHSQISKESRFELEEKLTAHDAVMHVRYFSPADSKRYIHENSATVGGVDSLPDEMFPAFFEVTVKNMYRNSEGLNKIADGIKQLPYVKYASYGEGWIQNMEQGKNALLSLLSFSSVIFGLAAALIIYQTVNVSMYKYRGEILVYKVVGATASFITMPFIVMSILTALTCVIASGVIYIPVHKYKLSAIEGITGLKFNLSWLYISLFTFAAVAVSALAAGLSARFFLKIDKSVADD